MKTYSELVKLPTFEERYEYLKLNGEVGVDTFGFERWLNQVFYADPAWKAARNKAIVRDNACDLGIQDRAIGGTIYVHHINPIVQDDIVNRNPILLDPENLICVSLTTHNAIHYGDDSLLIKTPKERTANDTCPWKNRKE